VVALHVLAAGRSPLGALLTSRMTLFLPASRARERCSGEPTCGAVEKRQDRSVGRMYYKTCRIMLKSKGKVLGRAHLGCSKDRAGQGVGEV
jgi:hypothetical protein